MRISWRIWGFGVAVAAAIAMIAAQSAPVGAAGTVASGTLFYTLVGGPVKAAQYRYDGQHFTFTHKRVVANTPDGDGLLFTPRGDLIITGTSGNDMTWTVDPRTGHYREVTQPTGVAHMALDPSKKFVWAASEPGSPVKIPLDPFRKGTVVQLTGDDPNITGLAFVPHAGHFLAFYTSSPTGGFGAFGEVNLKTRVTKERYPGLDAAHGISYDRYTGDLFLFGSDHVTQINPLNEQVVSDRNFDKVCGGSLTFDQGSTDGQGHALVASNDGHLLFVDFSKTRRVGASSNFVACPKVEDSLDDTAPLVGLGSPPLKSKPRPKPRPKPKPRHPHKPSKRPSHRRGHRRGFTG